MSEPLRTTLVTEEAVFAPKANGIGRPFWYGLYGDESMFVRKVIQLKKQS